MYCSHFHLKKKPFQLSSDNSFLWLGETHARALDLLKQGIDGREQLLVLTGDIGTGKTTLIHELRHYLPQTTAVAHISDPSIELNYLYLAIAQGLGFDDLYKDGENFDPVLWAFLNRRRRAQKKCLIIIDEAHLIPEQFLVQLPSWTNFAPVDTLTILLAGQLELHQVMEKQLGLSWETKVDTHAMLSPLEEKQTRDYINRRLELAGAVHKIFVPGAVREVHGYTKGIPRRINIACDQAMIAAYSKEMQTVDAQIFQEAVGVLEVPQVRGSKTPSAAPGSRWRSKRLPTLAAAVLMAVIACTFYFRNFFDPDTIPNLSINTPAEPTSPVIVKAVVVPNPVDSGGQRGGAESVPRQETFQAAPQIPPEPFGKIAAESVRSAEMDVLVNEDFMMHESDSIARGPDTSTQLTEHNAPAYETSTPPPVVPPISARRDPDPGPASTAQPDPEAIIDWLIKEKSL
nr:AAA family ATPase [uncultured Desulfobacter sp.]